MKTVADAWLDTTLCGGQVDAIAGIVPKHHRERVANNEAAFIDSVIELTTAETVTVGTRVGRARRRGRRTPAARRR